MRTLTKILVPGFIAGSVLLPSSVRAQPVDVQPPMPNVLVMLDTSGSMSRKMGSDAFPSCAISDPVARKADLDQSRWFAVVQALTGEVEEGDIECNAMTRLGNPFENLYGSDIYDKGYYIPFYQLQSDGCAYVPKKDDWDKKWHEFKDNAIVAETLSGAGCTWNQTDNGIIDAYKGLVRFGLMTFDPLVDPRVALQGEKDKTDSEEGSKGTYSYWFSTDGDWKGTDGSREGNWKQTSPAGYAVGRPPLCETDQEMEVGARGPAAPPWEGRLMAFGEYRAPVDDVEKQNDNIEKVILTARPFGATPLAGMFSDAADFILNDDTTYDPKGQARDLPFGPKDDDLWALGQGCRPFHVILITDGEPNLDLLPDCAADPTHCPFRSIVDSDLYQGHSGDDSTVNILAEEYNIVLHVVGVSLATMPPGATEDECADYRTGGSGADRCALTDATAEEKTCCLLNAIAEVGGSGQARFASSTAEVKQELALVLEKLAEGTASRTTPVYQSVSPTFHVENEDANAVGHEILSSLKTTVGSGMWNGRLERRRFACPGPERADFTAAIGDDFDDNLAVNPDQRFMYTVVPTEADETWKSIRPELASSEALEEQLGSIDTIATFADRASVWATDVDPAALDLTESACESAFGTWPEDLCRNELLKWYTGQESEAEIDRIPDTSSDAAREKSPSPLGAIYHSQPVIVGPPREFIRDESYDVFARDHADRPTVVYAATVDGQLHAFLLADNTARDPDDIHEPFQADVGSQNNELWSFVPPIVLPYLNKNVNKHSLLLDGGIAVKNLVFERTAGDLGAGVADYVSQVAYRTAMVVSSGNASTIKGGGYYFALDVSDPHPDAQDFDATDDAEPRYDTPKFLWQLSRHGDAATVEEAGKSLFGDNLPAAAITTIAYVDPSAATDPPKEIAVAILAGGRSDPPEGAATYTSVDYTSDDIWSGGDDDQPRDTVRNWGASRADRSLTIVRIDTGEILWRFEGQVDDPNGVVSSRVKTVGFHAPISGTPVPFPGLPGQVSSRVFVGDAEGMLWAVDLSNPNPTEWTMKIAWDAYHAVPEAQITSGAVAIGPVENVPVVSVDEVGDPVVIFATGSQESFYENTGTNYVVSLRDDPAEDGYQLNWELDLANTPDLGSAIYPGTAFNSFAAMGQRVTGPINIFDSVVYFSTFVPSGEACEVGVSRVWGVHYTNATEENAPIAAWDPDADGDDDFFEQDDDAIIFGVAIGQQPSCRAVDSETINDPVFGRYSTFQSPPPGGFELVVQTGRKGSAEPEPNEPTTRTRAWDLKTPVSSVRVDGWASIVE